MPRHLACRKGSVGSDEVKANFGRIGWGGIVNSDHDLGTDLFLMARDSRYFELGMLVGAQVKAGRADIAGSKYFKEKVNDPATGELLSWTFRGTREHFDYWLGHQLPHLIVLHDLDTRISYWEHLTADKVKYTKKRAKIFVPIANQVDAAHADALVKVAASRAARVEWEGSAWLGAAQLSPSRQLRYALLTPRLVAPHPNQGASVVLTAAQALALLVQLRVSDIGRFPSQDNEASARGAVSSWELVDSFRKFLQEGDPDVFATVSVSEAEPHERAAAAVVHAAALMEDGRPESARDVLEPVLAEDRLDPVDYAWVQVQHARTLIETGQLEQARNEVLPLIGLAGLAPGDVTAAAIGGAAAHLAFVASDWSVEDIAATLTAGDTTASWWRQQVSSWGLSEQARGSFNEWARDASVYILRDDPAWKHLRSASLMAGVLGDQGAWRCHSAQLGMYMVVAEEFRRDVDAVRQALTLPRVAGDHKALKLATRRVVRNGPAVAARDAAGEISLAATTYSTAHSDLVMLNETADLLGTTQAHDVAEWAMRTLADPDEYTERVRPGFLVRYELLDLLRSIVTVASPVVQDTICDFVLEQPAVTDQGLAGYLGKLVRKVPDRCWSADRVQSAVDRADGDHWELRYALLRAAPPSLAEVRERLQREASHGSLEALGALGDVRTIDGAVVQELVSYLAERTSELIRQANSGTVRRSIHDYGRELVLLNFWHSEHANWEAVYELLGEGRYGDYLAGPLKLLANQLEKLPAEVVDRLRPLARIIADAPPADFPCPITDAGPYARALLAAMERREAEPSRVQLAELVVGDTDSRRAAARQCGDPTDATALGVLLVLVGDSEPGVRQQAAAVIAERAALGDGAARAQLTRIARDPGVSVPRALAQVATADASGWLVECEEMRSLADHPSAQVRSVFGPRPA